MTATPGLPLQETHRARGAVFAERRGLSVVESYGHPADEYAAARTGAALVDLAIRGGLEASGPARQKLLQGMLTNDVAGRRPGQGCRAALLSARGAVQALVRALVDSQSILLETDFDRIETLQRVLEHHRVGAPVRFAARPMAVLALLGPAAADVLRAAGVPSPPDEAEGHLTAVVAGHAVRLVRAGDLPGDGFVLHAAPEAAAGVWEALRAAGARPAGFAALDARRVEAMRPWWGSDVADDNLLHEAGLVGECASFTKGCFIGQEVVARLEARGAHVSRALRGLRLEAPVAADAPVTADGRPVGRVTTAASSPRFGPIALGYVHRSHFAEGTAVEAGGVRATVVAAFEDGGAAAGGD